MEELIKGTCNFKVITDQSRKTGNEYKAIKLSFKDWELSTPIFINDDQLYLIKDKCKVK